MSKPRKWTKNDLVRAVSKSYSFRRVLLELGLVPAGGNYQQIKSYISKYRLATSHFKGKGWNRGMSGIGKPRIALDDILKRNSTFQSYKLKRRLFANKLKLEQCELCGWKAKTQDGRIPLELDHVSGDRYDNRLGNLRILCPNCHSLQPTHRGKNIRSKGGWRNWYTHRA